VVTVESCDWGAWSAEMRMFSPECIFDGFAEPAALRRPESAWCGYDFLGLSTGYEDARVTRHKLLGLLKKRFLANLR
jgi:hypothetical protein